MEQRHLPLALGSPDLNLEPELTDSAPFVPRAVVSDPWFQWDDDRRLRVPWHETVIYELHVKGFTQRHPEIPPELRGTFAGLATPDAIAHFQRLGVTAIELLPTHQFVHDHACSVSTRRSVPCGTACEGSGA